MRRSSLTAVTAALTAAIVAAGSLPAGAACTRLAFSVNDYGKDGPTNDAKSMLDKYIAKWAGEHSIATYKTGTKDVKCELFLNFIVFDEHTCRAEATVCWDGAPVAPTGTTAAAAPGDANGGQAKPMRKPTTLVSAKAIAAKPVALEASATAAGPGTETGALPTAAKSPAASPMAAQAAAPLSPAVTATAAVTPATAAPTPPKAMAKANAADQAVAAAEKAAAAAERAAAAAERAAAAAAAAERASTQPIVKP